MSQTEVKSVSKQNIKATPAKTGKPIRVLKKAMVGKGSGDIITAQLPPGTKVSKVSSGDKITAHLPSGTKFTKVYPFQRMLTSPIEAMAYVRKGVPAGLVSDLAAQMEMPTGKFSKLLGISQTTVSRKIKGEDRLKPSEGERVIEVFKLIELIEEMVNRSGNPEGFNAAQWFIDWAKHPVPALGNQCPETLLDTMTGLRMIENTLRAMESGAYL